MRGRDTKLIILCLIVMSLAGYMIYKAQGLKAMVAGSIGPGIYPIVCLSLLLVSGLLIIIKALVPFHFRLFSPYPSTTLQGLLVNKVAEILSRGIGERVAVQPAVGVGFFSAFYAGRLAKADGHTLVVLTGSNPHPSSFVNASLTLRLFEPICLLTFDPYVLLVSSERDAKSLDEAAGLHSLLSSAQVGLSCQEEAGEHLEKALRVRTGLDIEPRVYEAAQTMVNALNNGTIDVGFCLLSDIINSERLRELCHLVAVAGEDRSSDIPAIPTLKEFGINLICGDWIAIGVPTGTPRKNIDQYWAILSNSENMKALKTVIREYGGLEDVQGENFLRELLQEQARTLNEIGGQQEYDLGKEQTSLYRVIAIIGLFAMFVIVGPLIGYLPSSLGFLLILVLVLWPRKIVRVLPLLIGLAVGVALAIYWIFSSAFGVIFP